MAGERLLREDIVALLREAPLVELGRAADAMRARLHPEGVVTYAVDRNINSGNVCIAGCRFCAFYRTPGHREAFRLSFDTVAQKIEELLSVGGTQVLMQGGLDPGLTVEYYEALFRFIKQRFGVWLHSLSPPEIVHLSRTSALTLEETLRRLQAAGLDSLPGGGAEILCDRVRRQVSPGKCTAAEWLAVMEAAHALGMRSTATMVFGHLETEEDIAEHLLAVRELQDRTGGFTAFIPWSFQPRNTALSQLPAAGGHRYLVILAVSRLALDNVANVQASWVTQGASMAEVALRFGANDMGSTMLEENVVRAAGATFRLSRADIEAAITNAGFEPRQRDTLYRPVQPSYGEAAGPTPPAEGPSCGAGAPSRGGAE
jgi:cyclic dehypoxanthinyl futalosine synthase